MAAAPEKATRSLSSSSSSCCDNKIAAEGKIIAAAGNIIAAATTGTADLAPEISREKSSNLIRPVESLPESPTANAAAAKPKGSFSVSI